MTIAQRIIQRLLFVLREHDGCSASLLLGEFCGYAPSHALSIASSGSGSASR